METVVNGDEWIIQSNPEKDCFLLFHILEKRAFILNDKHIKYLAAQINFDDLEVLSVCEIGATHFYLEDGKVHALVDGEYHVLNDLACMNFMKKATE
jgi:hypothetical protein